MTAGEMQPQKAVHFLRRFRPGRLEAELQQEQCVEALEAEWVNPALAKTPPDC